MTSDIVIDANIDNDLDSGTDADVDTRITSRQKKSWYVYILRCADNSLYTGIALNVKKRLDEHNGITSNGAKYTQARRPVKLVYQEEAISRSDACKREYAIKSLSKVEKESMLLKLN